MHQHVNDPHWTVMSSSNSYIEVCRRCWPELRQGLGDRRQAGDIPICFMMHRFTHVRDGLEVEKDGLKSGNDCLKVYGIA